MTLKCSTYTYMYIIIHSIEKLHVANMHMELSFSKHNIVGFGDFSYTLQYSYNKCAKLDFFLSCGAFLESQFNTSTSQTSKDDPANISICSGKTAQHTAHWTYSETETFLLHQH